MAFSGTQFMASIAFDRLLMGYAALLPESADPQHSVMARPGVLVVED